MTIRSRSLTLLTTVVTAAGLAVAVPTTASAAAQGCTGAGIGTSCVYVKGAGLVPGEVTASRIKTNDAICGYKAIITVNSPGNVQSYRWDSGVLHGGGCSYGQAYVDHVISREFVQGSSVCSRFYENGVQQGGSACVQLSA